MYVCMQCKIHILQTMHMFPWVKAQIASLTHFTVPSTTSPTSGAACQTCHWESSESQFSKFKNLRLSETLRPMPNLCQWIGGHRSPSRIPAQRKGICWAEIHCSGKHVSTASKMNINQLKLPDASLYSFALRPPFGWCSCSFSCLFTLSILRGAKTISAPALSRLKVAVPPSTNATSSLHALLRVLFLKTKTHHWICKSSRHFCAPTVNTEQGSSTCVKFVEIPQGDPLHLTKCLWNAQPFKGCRLKCSQHLKQTYKQIVD